MKYYIIKSKTASINDDIINGIKTLDNDAEFVENLTDCDIAVLQQGWTRSKTAVAERKQALSELKIPCREGYLYTDKYKVHLNR